MEHCPEEGTFALVLEWRAGCSSQTGAKNRGGVQDGEGILSKGNYTKAVTDRWKQ